MANSDRPNGFKPIGEYYRARKYIAGQKIVKGELVRLSSDGKCDQVAAGESILGCAVSTAESDGDELMVIDDPNQYYVAQADESDIAAQTDIGNTCEVLATAFDTTFDAARMEIDSSTKGTTAQQLLIMDIQERPDNEFGAQADVIVKINEHQTRPTVFAGV